MSTSEKIHNKPASDSIDKAILEHGIKASKVFIEKELDLLLVVLTNGKVLRLKLSDYPRLQKANEQQLNDWRLIGNGHGIRWESLDEDLSVKGMIRDVVTRKTLQELTEPNIGSRAVKQ